MKPMNSTGEGGFPCFNPVSVLKKFEKLLHSRLFATTHIHKIRYDNGIICKTKLKIDNEQKISSSVFQRFSIFLLISQLLNSAENSAF